MITLTTEQAQQIEEALVEYRDTQMIKAPRKALSIIRAARAQEQAEQDLDTCPGCGGVADNGHDREFPPNPYYCTKCSDQAEQEPVAGERCIIVESCKRCPHSFGRQSCALAERAFDEPLKRSTTPPMWCPLPLYTHPVRTKDMTDDEVWGVLHDKGLMEGIRAVIAADRRKNK